MDELISLIGSILLIIIAFIILYNSDEIMKLGMAFICIVISAFILIYIY